MAGSHGVPRRPDRHRRPAATVGTAVTLCTAAAHCGIAAAVGSPWPARRRAAAPPAAAVRAGNTAPLRRPRSRHPQTRWQARAEEEPDGAEQTTILSQADLAAAREQAAHDPGVGDFFGPPSGPNPAAQQGWSPTAPPGPASGPQPLFEGALGGGQGAFRRR